MGLFGGLFRKKSLSSVPSSGGWRSIYESFTGAWQEILF
jgi:hypothetical protein